MHGDEVENCIYSSGQPCSCVTVGLYGNGVECRVECMAMELRTGLQGAAAAQGKC